MRRSRRLTSRQNHVAIAATGMTTSTIRDREATDGRVVCDRVGLIALGELLEVGDQGVHRFGRRPVDAADGVIDLACAGRVALEAGQRRAITLAEAPMHGQQPVDPGHVECFGRQPLSEDGEVLLHRGLLLLEPAPIFLEQLGIGAAEQDVLPLLHLDLEVHLGLPPQVTRGQDERGARG